MSLTKFASLEQAEVLSVKSAPERVKTASLSTLADFHDYRTSDGYVYARIRAISSRTNKNHDGWPTAELAGGSEAWERISSQHTAAEGFTVEATKGQEYGFPTFIGKPIFVDHNNSNPDRARGVIVDSKFNVLDHKTASADDYWGSEDVDPEHKPAAEVELLLEVDAESFPKLAQAIVDGEIDGFSMGCDVDYSKCSHCGHEASSPDEYCSHIVSKGAEHDYVSATGERTSKKSYENCYGIKFFEISAVFDPADETALAKEIRAEGKEFKTAAPLTDPYHKPGPEAVMIRARQIALENPGMQLAEAMQVASHELGGNLNPSVPIAGGDGAYAPDLIKVKDTIAPPRELDLAGPRYQGSYLQAKRAASQKTAQPEEPQAFHTTAPEDVDTLRKERICPLCGSDMDDVKCAVCGFEEPPESFQNPDLGQAEDTDELTDLADGNPDEAPAPEQALPGQDENPAFQKARNTPVAAAVKGDMRWTPKGISPRTAAPKPQGDEPTETVTSDQTTPVTSAFRTAQDMINRAAAAKRNQEKNHMADEQQKVAAEAPADAKPDKRVDVEGTGGVIDATNEEASKAEGAHSWENKGTQVDVEGKGGVLEDSNAEASEPSVGTQDVAKAVKTDDSGPTKTWDNSNEPDSAVSDKVFHGGAKKGTEPVDPSGKADNRVDVEEEVNVSWHGADQQTDQWTGTDGNGVTRQQDPVTKKVDPNITQRGSGLVSLAALKLVDQEIELGITSKEAKYTRLAELENTPVEEIQAEVRAYAKVAKTRKTASSEGATRVPQFGRIARDSAPAPQPVDDGTLDSALFS